MRIVAPGGQSHAKMEAKAIQLLLSHKDINVNLVDVDGKTPMDHARESGYVEVMNLLEARGGVGKMPLENS